MTLGKAAAKKTTQLILPLFLIYVPLVYAEENENYTHLYNNEKGDYLHQSGRLQLDSVWLDGDEESYSDINWRRFRLGLKGQVGEVQAAIEADINLNNDLDEAYNRLTSAYIKWNIAEGPSITVLKHDAKFTMDGSTSSTKLLTPQRNNLTNNLWFTAEYFSGVSIKGKIDADWSYNAGIFSSDDSDEISISQASYFTLFTLKKTFETSILWNKAELSIDYVYNDLKEDSNTRDFRQVASFTSKFTKNKWHLWSDLAMGIGDLGQSDILGVVVMPFYQQNEKIQWVTRYTYITSEQPSGLRLGRYENKVSEARGDKYHEVYAGVNYLFNNHKVKVHFGVQYVDMSDKENELNNYNGWEATIAFRSYW